MDSVYKVTLSFTVTGNITPTEAISAVSNYMAFTQKRTAMVKVTTNYPEAVEVEVSAETIYVNLSGSAR